MKDSELFLNAFAGVVRRQSFPSEAARLGDEGFVIGAATLAAAEFFRVPAQGVPVGALT